MKKLFIALILSLTLASGFTLAYEDVPNNSPYFHAVEFLRRAEVISDKTTLFKPDLIITRAEYIKYLVKINNREFKEKKTAQLPFKDTLPNAWYASYFEEALELGILSDRNEKAEPFKKLNRLEALELAFHSRGIPIPHRYVGPIPYTDVAKNKRARGLVMRALEMELIAPEKENYFGIYSKVNRAEAAQIIYKMELVTIGPPNFLKEEETKLVEDFHLQKILTTWDLIQKNFADREKIDTAKMSEEAVRSLMKTLNDPYSVYLDPVENGAFSDDLDGEIEGIGALIGFNEAKEIVIISPLIDSPASLAGFLAGDVIEKVNETPLEGASLEKAVSLIKGPKGTTVTLRIRRNGNRMDIAVVRDVIKVNSLESEVKDNGKVMFIRLMQFGQTAGAEFSKAAKQIQADPNIKGIILDLRNDPGGLLSAATQVLNFFLKPGSAMVQIQYNYINQIQMAVGSGALEKYPTVVLINKGSASASEIVAGALKDYALATLIGEKSFGKGSVQEVNFFKDDSSVKLTVAKWLTPLGHSIEGNGIAPDIEVMNQEGGGDEQLDRALEEIQNMINAR